MLLVIYTALFYEFLPAQWLHRVLDYTSIKLFHKIIEAM